jgi:signal transduction histidine kinase
MQSFAELKDYVGFDTDDEARLRRLLPTVLPHATGMAGRFYDTILRFPDARGVFEDLAQVNRLKVSLVRWIEELLTGPWDDAYGERRKRIGQVHVRVGLPSGFMFTAMNRLMEDLHVAVADDIARDPLVATSLRKIADLELALMVGTYIEAREKQGLEGLRDILVSHLPTAVLLIDKDGKVATSTTPWKELFARGERTSAVDPSGLPLDRALHPEVLARAHVVSMLERAKSTGREIVVPRIDVRLGPGAPLRTLRIAIIPLQHPLADALIHIEDLTETLASEARAKQAEHLARLGTMAASVAHEIRNPLAGISGTVQVIKSAMGDDDPRRLALNKVQDQVTRLGNLVGDLLSFARPISAQCRIIDLSPVAKGTAAEAVANQYWGNASCVVDIKGSGSAVADPGLLAQVALNLVQNAVQSGAKRVEVHVADGAFDVVDDGPGISEEARAQIFEPFFTTKIRGTGLGLPVALKMIEAMRGTLDVGISPLGGAAFLVRLPTTP